MLLHATSWNIDHGGQDRASGHDDQRRWNTALELAEAYFADPDNPHRVVLVQEAFLWQRLGRIARFADATATTPYRAEGVNDLDLVAFVGPGLTVGDWRANPRHLRSPAVAVPVRADGVGEQITLVTTHLDPWSADVRVQQVLALNSFLRDQRVLLGGDLNCIGPSDPEPNLDEIPDWQVYNHLSFAPLPAWDRRPTQIAEYAGWVDLAARFDMTETPTGGFGQPFPAVRFDQFWATPTLAEGATGYQVHDADDFKTVSDHLPITVTLTLGT
jgi:hypothetical protein